MKHKRGPYLLNRMEGGGFKISVFAFGVFNVFDFPRVEFEIHQINS